MNPVVVAVVATYRRPDELSRLLSSLEGAATCLRAVVVADNGNDSQIRAITERSRVPGEYVAASTNLGCGGGLRLGEQRALEKFPELTHIWILDDDAVVTEGALEILFRAMEAERADAAHPLVIAPDGTLGWFPGLLDRRKFRIIRQRQTPSEFVARCGDAPIPFSWCQGIALLVTRRIFDELGFHRDDYWVRGEDLEFSLRITHCLRGIYVPGAHVHHLPPAGPTDQPAMEYAKHRAMLQNLAFLSLRSAHGRRLIRTLPGNWVRFLRTWKISCRTTAGAIGAFVEGAILGRPAGARSSRTLPTGAK